MSPVLSQMDFSFYLYTANMYILITTAHCKYIDGTEYCGCLCYVSSTSGVVLTTANGSVLSMTVQNLKYSLKRQLAEFQLLLLKTFSHTSYYQWQQLVQSSMAVQTDKCLRFWQIILFILQSFRVKHTDSHNNL